MNCIGDAGRQNDSGVFGNCSFGQALTSNALHIPDDRSLPGKNYDNDS